ncbi:MAG: MBL fold metallo-hydrolase [Proteobacteria bacterium]|nr:MBL fold metallo-hydrolase [Pseudomonadota bacterium]
MEIETLFDGATYTLTYVVFDKGTKDAVIIDPVLDFDPASGKTTKKSIRNLLEFINDKKLNVHYILETHAHADHLSGAHELVTSYFPKAKIAISERITEVQETFKPFFNFPPSFKTDGSQFHKLLKDNETIKAGSLEVKTIFTPGHTPACASFLIGDALFAGDAIFMPDYGTGRCDFPKGDAEALYDSIANRIYALSDSTRIFVGHDYQPNGRELKFETTVGESKRSNIQLKSSTKKDEFVNFRRKRDATLNAPKLLLPSIQVNIAAGELPQAESNGKVYLKLPLTNAE